MAASKIIVSENIEVPVVDGKIQCIRCRDWKLPGEMHFKDRICQACYETIRARNRDKPKPKKKNEKIIKRNGMGWVERVEKPTRTVGDSELAKMIVLERAVDRNMLPGPITVDGGRVADTKNGSMSEIDKESHSLGGVTVAATNEIQTDAPKIRSITGDGGRVADTEKRLNELEGALGATNERLANALRKIRALEEKLEKLSPVIEKEEAKRDAANLQRLRDDLFKLLRERMEKSHTNGIYVHSLYGPNGRAGGKLNISKRQAFRLRDACRGDDRFKVEKTENQQGNWAILLNIHMR